MGGRKLLGAALCALAMPLAAQAAPADEVKALLDQGKAADAYALGKKFPDQLGNPAFSTPIGLLLWGANHLGAEPIAFGNGSAVGGGFGRIGDWLRGLFPG